MVQFLIEHGADVDAKSFVDGWTPLLSAAANSGHFNVVKYLVENGANICAKNKFEQTAFKLAHVNGHTEVAKYLMEKMVDLQAESDIPEEIISNKTQCVVCFRPKNAHFALLPCMHVTLCESCCFKITTQDNKTCPTCRQPVQEYRKIFF